MRKRSEPQTLKEALRSAAQGCAALAFTVVSVLAAPGPAKAAESIVYGMYRPVDLGFPGDAPQKDYYINMGRNHGVREGSTLEIYRRASTFDLQTEKFYADILFPIARVKVIHVEGGVAVARLEKMNAPEKTPVSPIRGIMIGDIVRFPGKE